MASSLKFKELDPAHVETLDTLKRRFHTTTNSRALSRLLDEYLKDAERLRLVTEQRDTLVRRLLDRRACLAQADAETKRANRADVDAQAFAVDIAKESRQFRTDLP